ncbi:hypothetical protein GcM1_237005 [Golovinomyces cichoracearum]|uniref:Uncharacterized protein n=1 Tax=Golovinomyces cichoracearum TaxID=62708 RepID=A0A420IJP4_9PEZI|nr:hypothetical protein GcM1_237005 [Golovinomyces cichoracearum]
MSAFSRGILPWHNMISKPLRFLHSPRSNFRPQLYSTASLLRQKAKICTSKINFKQKPPTTKPQKEYQNMPTINLTAVRSNPGIYQTYAMTLAQKSHSTLLYTAPSSSAYFISSYVAATFCFTYGVLSYWNNYLCAPPDIAAWIPYAFTGVSLATILFGIRFLRNPVRIVQNMTGRPKISNDKPTLEIEIELKRMLPIPFLQPKVISVAPNEIFVPTYFVRPLSSPLSKSELRAQKIEENLRRQAELEYERSHIMSAGIRHLWRAIGMVFTSIFRATQRAFTQDNFLEMRIRGKIYKLDLDGGWALDKGKAIDRLVTVEPHSQTGLINKLTQ